MLKSVTQEYVVYIQDFYLVTHSIKGLESEPVVIFDLVDIIGLRYCPITFPLVIGRFGRPPDIVNKDVLYGVILGPADYKFVHMLDALHWMASAGFKSMKMRAVFSVTL